MQFYLDGYRAGDPLVEEPHSALAERAERLPAEVDLLVVGCGPAGLVMGAQMARFPDIRTAVIDRREGPLEVGQADGVSCRTVEMLQTFGLANRLIDEAYSVNEVCFWQPDPQDPARIKRTGRVADTDPALSEFPHLIVNQARMLAHLLDYMRRSSSRLTPFYGLHASDLSIDTSGDVDHPVTVTVRQVRGGTATSETLTVRAKYVVGCDGARSAIRSAIGRELVGDTTNVSWGVMDVLGSTDFPDIRRKCTIQSADRGTIVLIPREGGYLTRFYVELDEHAEPGASVSPTLAKIVETANQILHPYTFDVQDVGWWSVYEIGQRLCEKFDDVPTEAPAGRAPRVFIAGDACHTHSAKAGQGMNVAMADAFNLGWKLAAVLKGIARPELLHTYSQERQAIAQELIAFDEEWSGMLSAPPSTAGDNAGGGVDPDEFRRYFVRHAGYTAGVTTRYAPSLITSTARFQDLAGGFRVGTRFHSAPVIRVADAKPMHLGHGVQADGAWRLYVFADHHDPTAADSRARALCLFLGSRDSPRARFTPAGARPDAVIDVRAIFQQSHRYLELTTMPPVLLPRKGRFGLVDREKIFCPDPRSDDIFDLRAVNRETGCIVLVRPDQYVADVLPLAAHEMLVAVLAKIFVDVV